MEWNRVQIKQNDVAGIFTEKEQKTEKESPLTPKLPYLGEENNQNLRTRVNAAGDTGIRLKEEEKRGVAFKNKVKETKTLYETNRKSLHSELLAQMTEEGIHAEKSDGDLVKESISHILENREKKRESIRNQVAEKIEDREQIEKVALATAEDKAVAAGLLKTGIPITPENISTLTAALHRTDQVIRELSEPAMEYLVGKELPATVENLYKAEQMPQRTDVESEKESLWEEMKGKAEELLFGQGVESSEETMAAAKWLFLNGKEIRSENVADYLSLKQLKEGVDDPKEQEERVLKLAGKMAEGADPLTAEQGSSKLRIAQYHVFYFHSVVETKEIFREVTARRQIEEIRLKLTEETALRMLKKGIKIDVNDLKGLVKELREEEGRYFQALSGEEEGSALSTYGQDDNALSINRQEISNFTLFQSTLSIHAYALRQGEESTYTYGAVYETYQSEMRFSIREYHEAGLAYEKNATEIRADLGDRMKKAFANIDEILELHGLEKSDENRRAVRMLSYNRAEVNMESVFRMKQASLLSEEVFREMKPATVVRLIRNGENPMDLPFEELLKKLKQINEEREPEEERFSTFLYRLEQKGEMNTEERKAYIGIYRLLTQVEKTDGAAVGSVSLAKKGLTLRSLLEAVRTRKHGVFDRKAEEGLGELAGVLSEHRIDRSIEEAYAAILAGKLKTEMESPTKEYFEETLRSMKEKEVAETDIEKLMEVGQTVHFSSLTAQEEIRKGRKNLYSLLSELYEEEREEVKSLSDSILTNFAEGEERTKVITKLNERLLQKATDFFENDTLTFPKAKELLGIKNVIALSGKRAEAGSFDLPLLYGEDQIADLQITVRKSRTLQEKGKLSLRLHLEEEEIGWNLYLQGERVSGLLFATRREEYDKLKAGEELFKKSLSSLGLTAGELSYHIGTAPSGIVDSDDIYSSRIETKTLYELAKKAAAHVLQIMEMR